MNNKIIGNFGENIATQFLKSDGYTILKNNFRTRLGEIDIIAKKDDTIFFIEVKTRTSDSFGLPRQSVTTSKQKTIRKIAPLFLSSNKLTNYNVSFDVIEVYCNHIKRAF